MLCFEDSAAHLGVQDDVLKRTAPCELQSILHNELKSFGCHNSLPTKFTRKRSLVSRNLRTKFQVCALE